MENTHGRGENQSSKAIEGRGLPGRNRSDSGCDWGDRFFAAWKAARGRKTETTAVENVEIKSDVNIREKTDDRKDRVKPNASEKLKVEVPPPPPKPESVSAEMAAVAKSGTRSPEAKRKDDRRRKEAEKWRAMRDQDIVVESGGRIAKPGERTSTVTMSSAQELKVKPKAAPKKAARPAPRRPSAVGAMPGAEAGYGEPAPEEST